MFVFLQMSDFRSMYDYFVENQDFGHANKDD